MKISARNQLSGIVRKITYGAVNAEIVLKLPGGHELVSIVTKASASNLKLKKGVAVMAVIKSSDVLLAVPCTNRDCECKK